MSGGMFDYKDFELSDIIEKLKEDNYPNKDLILLLDAVMQILHSYDWFRCGDISEKEFKQNYNTWINEIRRVLR